MPVTFNNKKDAIEYVQKLGKQGYSANILKRGNKIYTVIRINYAKKPKPENIDKRIRDIVLEFNKEGFRTSDSCAGHKGEPEGYIWFIKKYPHKKLREKLKKYGIKEKVIFDLNGRTTVTFEPVGGSKNKNYNLSNL